MKIVMMWEMREKRRGMGGKEGYTIRLSTYVNLEK